MFTFNLIAHASCAHDEKESQLNYLRHYGCQDERITKSVLKYTVEVVGCSKFWQQFFLCVLLPYFHHFAHLKIHFTSKFLNVLKLYLFSQIPHGWRNAWRRYGADSGKDFIIDDNAIWSCFLGGKWSYSCETNSYFDLADSVWAILWQSESKAFSMIVAFFSACPRCFLTLLV